MSLIKFVFSKTFLIQLGLAIVAVVLIVFITLQWLKSTTNHGEYVTVPDLSKKSLRLGKDVLEKANLVIGREDSTEYDPNTPRFSIMDQEPKAGAKVKEGRKINIKINPSGYRKITVPEVKQLTKRNAEAILKAIGLNVGDIVYVDDIGKDMVLGALHDGDTIYKGDQLTKTSVVNLICGNGVNPDGPKFDNEYLNNPTDSIPTNDNGGNE